MGTSYARMGLTQRKGILIPRGTNPHFWMHGTFNTNHNHDTPNGGNGADNPQPGQVTSTGHLLTRRCVTAAEPARTALNTNNAEHFLMIKSDYVFLKRRLATHTLTLIPIKWGRLSYKR